MFSKADSPTRADAATARQFQSPARVGSSAHIPWPPPTIAIAGVALLLLHVAVLAIFSHSPSVGTWSDFLELGAVLLATLSCFLTSRRSHGIARPFWYLTGSAFATWSAGKCIIVYNYEFVGLHRINILALLLFFLAAAPMFVAIFLSDENFQDRISWE